MKIKRINDATTANESGSTKPIVKRRRNLMGRNWIQNSENKLCIKAGPNLQALINYIPSTIPGIKKLRIMRWGMGQNPNGHELAVPMPQLEKILISRTAWASSERSR
jgi:hypothetical protein